MPSNSRLLDFPHHVPRHVRVFYKYRESNLDHLLIIIFCVWMLGTNTHRTYFFCKIYVLQYTHHTNSSISHF